MYKMIDAPEYHDKMRHHGDINIEKEKRKIEKMFNSCFNIKKSNCVIAIDETFLPYLKIQISGLNSFCLKNNIKNHTIGNKFNKFLRSKFPNKTFNKPRTYKYGSTGKADRVDFICDDYFVPVRRLSSPTKEDLIQSLTKEKIKIKDNLLSIEEGYHVCYLKRVTK